jgi:hypothetical protein
LAALLICFSLLPLSSTTAQTPPPQAESAPETPSALIIENVGQFGEGARYQVWGGQGTTWLAEDAIWITLLEPAPDAEDHGMPGMEPAQAETPRKGVNLRLSFEGANPHPQLEPFGPSETVVSYFLGNDPGKWRPDVPVWTGVRYVDLYPGLDLEVGGASGGWGWRMVAREGAGAQQAAPLQNARLRVEGADQLSLEDGALRVQTAVGAVDLPLMSAEDAEGNALALPRGATVAAGSVAAPFALRTTGARSAASPSQLVYGTYLGGANTEIGRDIAVDDAGQAYVTGEVWAGDFPSTPGSFDPNHNGDYDVFVCMLSTTGSALVYGAFLGGIGSEYGNSIVLDGARRAYITGYTESRGFPNTEGAYKRYLAGEQDAFVSALSADGTALVYSTYLGGHMDDEGVGIALDGAGRAWVAGETTSSSFPCSPGAYDTTYNGGGYSVGDAFACALSADGSSLEYGTFLGGSSSDAGHDISVSGGGQACVTGLTHSSDYPVTAGCYDGLLNGTDAFVTVLDVTGSALTFSTFLGGNHVDVGWSTVLAENGRAYVAGYTYSTDYPTTPGAYDTVYNGGETDAFVAVFEPAGSALLYSTLLGGSSDDDAYAMAVDSAGRAYVTGKTISSDFPSTFDAYNPSHNGGADIYVGVLSPGGSTLVFGTFVGGSGSEGGAGMALDHAGNMAVTGFTDSSDFPVTSGAFDTTFGDRRDVCVAMLSLPASTHFDPATEWWDGLKNWAPQNRYPRMAGDVDGDGDDDVVAFNPSSGVWVALSTGTALQKPANWTSEFAWLQGSYNWRAIGDVNGDGKGDIVGWKYGDGVYVALSTGTSFAPSTEWLDAPGAWGPQSTYPRLVGDANGDGKDDIVTLAPGTGGLYVALSTGSAFGALTQWSAEPGALQYLELVALCDVDGDGDDDLVHWRYGEGVFVALSDGDSYGACTLWWNGLKYWGPDNRYPRLVGDVTGDGKADVVAWNPDSGGWVAESTGTAFLKPVQWTTDFAITPNAYYLHALGDMNGDGREDAVLFWYGEGVYVALSSGE